MAQTDSLTGEHNLVPAGLGAIVGGLLYFVVLLAFAELIGVALAIERNTWRTAQAVLHA